MKMQKRIRLLYSDSKKGIMEELAEFKREPCVYNPKAPKLIAHRNGHYTALVWYQYREQEVYCHESTH